MKRFLKSIALLVVTFAVFALYVVGGLGEFLLRLMLPTVLVVNYLLAITSLIWKPKLLAKYNSRDNQFKYFMLFITPAAAVIYSILDTDKARIIWGFTALILSVISIVVYVISIRLSKRKQLEDRL